MWKARQEIFRCSSIITNARDAIAPGPTPGHARLTTTAPPVASGTFPRRVASNLTMPVTLNRQRPLKRPPALPRTTGPARRGKNSPVEASTSPALPVSLTALVGTPPAAEASPRRRRVPHVRRDQDGGFRDRGITATARAKPDKAPLSVGGIRSPCPPVYAAPELRSAPAPHPDVLSFCPDLSPALSDRSLKVSINANHGARPFSGWH